MPFFVASLTFLKSLVKVHHLFLDFLSSPILFGVLEIRCSRHRSRVKVLRIGLVPSIGVRFLAHKELDVEVDPDLGSSIDGNASPRKVYDGKDNSSGGAKDSRGEESSKDLLCCRCTKRCARGSVTLIIDSLCFVFGSLRLGHLGEFSLHLR